MQLKLTNREVELIKREFINGKKQKDIAKKYGTTQSHVANIIGGRKRVKSDKYKLKGITKINIAKGDGYMKIEIDGHNEDDIVCAGISAIIQTCELGLKALAVGRKSVIIRESEYDLNEQIL